MLQKERDLPHIPWKGLEVRDDLWSSKDSVHVDDVSLSLGGPEPGEAMAVVSLRKLDVPASLVTDFDKWLSDAAKCGWK